MRVDARIVLLTALILASVFLGKKVISTARGIRNNNPGNLRLTGVTWAGQVPQSAQTDPAFVQFTAPEYGIRAMARTLDTYASRGFNTIEKVIGAWAPSNENDTDGYVRAVVSQTGIPSDRVLTRVDYPALITAIIRRENGSQPYEPALILRGIQMA